MQGLVFVAPGSFNSPEGLPIVPVNRLSPIGGAVMDWAAETLPDGIFEKWDDLLGGYSLNAPSVQSQWPVKADGAVVFDGINDRIDTNFPAGQPKTIVLVARMPGAEANARVFTGGTGDLFDLGINSTQTAFTFYAGDGISANDFGSPDSNWHVFIVVANGESSVISVDGIESTGNPGANPGGTLRLGATGGAYKVSEVKRLAILPYAADADERSLIDSQMAAYYGLG